MEGLGGLDTVRGVPRNRYGGNTKVLGNVELCWAAAEIPWGPAPLQIGLSGFYDTGRVWQPGEPNGKSFDASQWHSGAGGGLRLMRRAAVIRANFGFDLETKRTGNLHRLRSALLSGLPPGRGRLRWSAKRGARAAQNSPRARPARWTAGLPRSRGGR